MITKEDINNTINKMILSASGWRGVFAACGDEESKSEEISPALKIIFGAAAYVFNDYVRSQTDSSRSKSKPVVFLGTDTRPTGKAIVEAIIPVLLAVGCDVRYAGVIAAPEIMAWARNSNLFTTNQHEPTRTNAGFIYISASHNPIGHNGIKFGLTDGGVLVPEEAAKLIDSFRAFLDKDDCIDKIKSLTSGAEAGQLANVYNDIGSAKTEAFKAYYNFSLDVIWDGQFSMAAALKEILVKYPIGIVCDFNGSARTVSIDKELFNSLGFKFECINSEPGQIVHRIVPEGESLEPCCRLLEEARLRDPSFVLGYVPDCDGDRGNLVIWDDTINKARALEAQEVFALACVAELSHLVCSGTDISKAAVAINDPTSMRVDRIAEAFGISVFRAEVGEANVVSLARKLREDGYLVRILGEGSAGGNITHPSAVRDPIHTVLAIAKMLSLPGLYEVWCKSSGQAEKYRDNFSLADVIASLPQFITTAAYNENAIMRIKTQDHALLKDRYQEVFLQEWEKREAELKERFNICAWEAIAYIWMRGSATEPVFRIMADVETSDAAIERYLLDWQRYMIMVADNAC